MKKTFLISLCVLLVSMLGISSKLSAQHCNYAMSRQHATYFASSQGYRGSGMLPILSKADFKRMMTQEWHDYYKYEVPVCSYCKDPDVLRSWDSSVALCNIANYYHHRYMTDVQGSMRFMDLEIERLSRKRN